MKYFLFGMSNYMEHISKMYVKMQGPKADFAEHLKYSQR
jgi:hypothetical protein